MLQRLSARLLAVGAAVGLAACSTASPGQSTASADRANAHTVACRQAMRDHWDPRTDRYDGQPNLPTGEGHYGVDGHSSMNTPYTDRQEGFPDCRGLRS